MSPLSLPSLVASDDSDTVGRRRFLATYLDPASRLGEVLFGLIIGCNVAHTWSELSLAPAEWCRLGVVVDRTKALGSNTDIRRGPLIGFTYRNVDFTTYWLSPGAHDSTLIFALAFTF